MPPLDGNPVKGATNAPSVATPEESNITESVEDEGPFGAILDEGPQQPAALKAPTKPWDLKISLEGSPPKQSTEVPASPKTSGDDPTRAVSNEIGRDENHGEVNVNDKDGGSADGSIKGKGPGPEKDVKSHAMILEEMQRRMDFLEQQLGARAMNSQSDDERSNIPHDSKSERSDGTEMPLSEERPVLPRLKYLDQGEYYRGPVIFYRPFKFLFFYEPEIPEVFRKLQSRWGGLEKFDNSGATSVPDQDNESKEETSKQDKERMILEENRGDLIPDFPPKATQEERLGRMRRGPPLAAGIDNNEVDSADANASVDRAPDPGVRRLRTKSIGEDQTNYVADTQAADEDQSVNQAEVGVQRVAVARVTEASSRIMPQGEFKARETSAKQGQDEPTDELRDLTDSVKALRDFRCLIEFMDDQLQPAVHRHVSRNCPKIFYSDLWPLFKPGELIYAPLNRKPDDNVAVEIIPTSRIPKAGQYRNRYQEVGKIMSTADQRIDCDDKLLPAFWVEASFVDFDGSLFGRVIFAHRIAGFATEREISSLELYPLKFAPNREVLEPTLLARGRIFKEYMLPRHKYYLGRSLVYPPEGFREVEDEFPSRVGNIDSQVIVDFAKALAENPGWAPRFSRPTEPILSRKGRDEFDRFEESTIDTILTNDCIENDELARLSPDRTVAEGGEISDEHLMLLPNRVFAFVMKKRKFAILTVDGLRDTISYRDGFKDLKLPAIHNRIVSSLVHDHLHNKRAKLKDREMGHGSDIVRGKGKGLIVLLHGAPGVGKTSTAETVAEAYRRPLFPITCGDLGTTAREVERGLEDAFHLAERWDCVLLLDEADVFLAQRSRTDIKRNSLVSVFLRVLEYFTGILFLTTNRVGAFDQAFKSRVHISLYLPLLDWPQTKAIWEMNLDKLTQKKRLTNERFRVDEDSLYTFAQRHFEESYSQNLQWNGRQIRNPFQTAVALAEFEAHEVAQHERKNAPVGAELAPFETHLKVEHFDTVRLASTEFDDYLYNLRGRTDSSRAFLDQERADQYQSARTARSHRVQPVAQGYHATSQRPHVQMGVPNMQGHRPPQPSQQQLPRHPQSYVKPQQQYMGSRTQDDTFGEEEDPEFGQTCQGSLTSLP